MGGCGNDEYPWNKTLCTSIFILRFKSVNSKELEGLAKNQAVHVELDLNSNFWTGAPIALSPRASDAIGRQKQAEVLCGSRKMLVPQ